MKFDPKVDGRLRAPLKTSATENTPGGRVPPSLADDSTGRPGLRSWRTVYVVVAGIVVLWIVLLTVLTKFYS